MKRFIRYLYEYEQGKRKRNVGFVKVEAGNERTTLNVQAKGFRDGGDRRLMLYLFYEDKERLTSLLRERMTIVSPFMNCCMMYTKNDVGIPENYEKINGVLIVTEDGRRIAATWDDRVVDVSRVKEFEPVTESQVREFEPVTEESGQQKETSGLQTQEIEEISPASVKKQKTITKIQRQDISKLPHCEWNLANNRFLIHGYNNYHYLVLIEDENILKLGVPGIYHIKEEKYAAMFGFGEFYEVDEMFGYWCRPVKRRQSEKH